MLAQPPLSQQLVWTARTVEAVLAGRSLSEALPRVPAEWRPGVQALVFHGLRHWGEARALVARLTDRPPAPTVLALLGVALTLCVPSDAPLYPAHTVVDQAVAAVALLRLGRGAAGLVNACLRRYLREASVLQDDLQQDAEARWNHPFWWIKRLRRDHPLHWQAMLAASQQPGAMTLRVNRRQIGRDAYLSALQGAGMAAQPWGEDGVVLHRPVAVERLPGWAEGWVSVQDAAAQLAAPLLLGTEGLSPGARVLDACAAPGGKTAHLLECADLDLLALDVSPPRCERIRDNLRRLQLQAEVRAVDAAQPATWGDGRPFDAILLDAPCTASGIVRRHPDVRWLRRPEDVDHLAAQQQRLLTTLWPLLRPGGRLLYATCSVFRAEGEGQVRAFMAAHPDAERLPAPGHLMPGQSWPPQPAQAPALLGDNAAGGLDGFFYALLQRKP